MLLISATSAKSFLLLSHHVEVVGHAWDVKEDEELSTQFFNWVVVAVVLVKRDFCVTDAFLHLCRQICIFYLRTQ